MYVLVSGRARVVKRTETGDEIPLNILHAGDSFGEIEMIDGRTRSPTVRASSDVLSLRLDRGAFEELLGADPNIRTYLDLQLKHSTLQTFFRGFPHFARLSAEAVVGIVLADLEPTIVEAGSIPFREGDPAGPLYLVEEGRLRLLHETSKPTRYVTSVGTGEYFGEMSALTRAPVH